MVFSKEDKIIIQNDYEEKAWSAYQIWKSHTLKNWNYSSVKRLLKRFKDNGTMDRKEGSGRTRTVTTEENADLIEDAPQTHLAPRKIAEQTGISRSSVRRMVKRRNFRQFKRVKTPQMNSGCRNRRYDRATALAEKFENNCRMVEKTVWQDEKDFTLDVPVNLQNDRVYGKGKKSDVPARSLFASTNKMSRKVMVSAAVSWYGATKPFFVNNNGIKVNKENYCKHLKKQLFPAIDKLVKRDDWIFVQDSAPSHRSNLVQDFLEQTLKRRFVKSVEWPPASPDANPLDYFFWDLVKCKVYKGRAGEPFKSEDELKIKIKAVWNDCATDLTSLRKAIKQFVPRLRAIEERQGHCIKMTFG